ncbi:MAG: DUF6314 family protein [Streptosporangiaceae bacterium]
MDADRSCPPAAEICGTVVGPAPLAAAAGAAGFLLGDWIVARKIRDNLAARSGSFRGTARFMPAPDCRAGRLLLYREQGQLRFAEYCGPASRRLCYRELPGGAADVQFADGRAFYQLDLRAGRCQAEHLCGHDRYAVCVCVLSSDSFTESWRVTGPAKDYELTTSYVRTGSQR